MYNESTKSQTDRALRRNGNTVTLMNREHDGTYDDYGDPVQTVTEKDIPAFYEFSGAERAIVGPSGEERTVDAVIYVGDKRTIYDGENEQASTIKIDGINYEVLASNKANENGYIRCRCRRER